MNKALIAIVSLTFISLISCGNSEKENSISLEVEKEIVNDILEVSVENLRLRNEPKLSSSTILMLPIGTQLFYEGKKSNDKFNISLNNSEINDYWYYVKTTDGKLGWVHGCCIFNPKLTGKGKFPETSARLLRENDISELDYKMLKIMRNEIYARHGHIFKTGGEMEKYFKAQTWYSPSNTNAESALTDIEKYNVNFIIQAEEIQGLQAELESDEMEYGESFVNDSNSRNISFDFDGTIYNVNKEEWEEYKKSLGDKYPKSVLFTFDIRKALYQSDTYKLNKIANTYYNGISEGINETGMTMKIVGQIQMYDLLRSGDIQFE